MTDASITTWGHAAVRIERDGRRLAIDPGMFSDPAVLDGAHGVLITHEHHDHVASDRVLAALAADAALELWAPAGVVEQLTAAGAPPDRVRAVADGDQVDVAGFAVRVLGHDHAVLHPTLPVAVNVAYLVEDLALHPGDSFTPPPAGTTPQVLLLPVSAPWLKLAEAIDYLAQVSPQVALPIHDAVLSDAGKALVDRILGGLPDSRYRRLDPGEQFQLPLSA